MPIGRFLGGVAGLIYDDKTQRYLLLRRAALRDFKAGHWECVTGRVDQEESFEEALHREVMEEINAKVQIEFIIATSHFYRGDQTPQNELLSIIYGCRISDPSTVRLDSEHSEMRWITTKEALNFLPEGHWMREVILRAELLRKYLPEELRNDFLRRGFEI